MSKWLMLFCGAFASAECVRVGPELTSKVEVSGFVGPTGEHVDGLVVQGIDTRKPVPYGTYQVRISAPGFSATDHAITVDQPIVRVRVLLQVGVECGGDQTISGTIRGGKGLWMKAVPIIGSGGGEAKIEENGTFSIGGLAFGKYVVMLIGNDQLLKTEVVTAPGKFTMALGTERE